MTLHEIIDKLPYTQPFLFVDELTHVDDESAQGTYLFKGESDFYKGHFKDIPVTPGVILTECCAQIGLVCLGIYLLQKEISEGEDKKLEIAMSSSEMEFYLPVLPDEKVKVVSEKIYFRFGKLKCKVKMLNNKSDVVCKGILAGMFKQTSDEK
ncbi:3-hydroxyacyl-ACP dehydratase FabZ family protein [Flagellimonas sp. CMM7]|uniref:3-hydroxyacyl-ACP dehydratase FabZ family protein n=1 Tax=Flagellimonas sp. CMM7 TaxID=2654676 RepID=UPI0013D008EF|nr:hydroxymyristoyl-ACP dehydratase [Flagellimonas sp. CMM7]UII81905.1 hydroxymyristoyl-ACP dehydratase [Flagellimonas sp. CMM7]